MSTINNLNDNNVSKLLLDAGEIDQSIYEKCFCCCYNKLYLESGLLLNLVNELLADFLLTLI